MAFSALATLVTMPDSSLHLPTPSNGVISAYQCQHGKNFKMLIFQFQHHFRLRQRWLRCITMVSMVQHPPTPLSVLISANMAKISKCQYFNFNVIFGFGNVDYDAWQGSPLPIPPPPYYATTSVCLSVCLSEAHFSLRSLDGRWVSMWQLDHLGPVTWISPYHCLSLLISPYMVKNVDYVQWVGLSWDLLEIKSLLRCLPWSTLIACGWW